MSTGSSVLAKKSLVSQNKYKYTIVRTSKIREVHGGLIGIFIVNTVRDIDAIFLTDKLGWIDGGHVTIVYKHKSLSSAIYYKNNAKFYFGDDKLIIKNLKACFYIHAGKKHCENIFNGEYKVVLD